MTSKKQTIFKFAPALVILLFLFAAPPLLGSVLTSLLVKILIFGLLAMSLDIAFGYTGMWSFCHASFFGVAAYTVAILLEHSEITSFWLLAPAGILMAVLVTALFGLIALRVSGIYFLLITFALGQLVYSVVLKGGNLTRGHDGLGGIPYPDIGFSLSRGDFYYFILIIFLICVFVIYRVIKSPFGYTLQGIRESETRMRILGYNIWLHKYIAFIISGLFAGISGVLYVFYNGLIVPENVGFAASGVAMIIIIIGGSGTLWGALIGSVVIFLLNYYVSILIPARWPIVLGACFVGAAMFTRAGIFPQLNNLWTKASKSWLS